MTGPVAAFCPTCGKPRQGDETACGNCGASLVLSAATPTSSPSPPQAAAPYLPPPAYQQPVPPAVQMVVPAQPRTNGFAIASLVLGIVWIYWIGSILALVFGYVAKGQIAKSNGWQTGGGMATAGIVLGWIGVGVLVLVIIVGVLSAGRY